MAKIAVDIVLLPSQEMMDKAIEINRELLKKFENKIILNKENCLPHVSLVMGCVDEKDLPNIEKILQELGKQFSSMNLTVEEIYTYLEFSGLKVKKTPELQLLHETVMRRLADYFSYDAEKSMFYIPPEIGDIVIVKEYPTKSSFSNYFPHITVGFGEIKEIKLPTKFKFPIKFIASKLALCHLGNHCTCRKILLLIELKS